MTLNAFKNGVSTFDETTMNALLAGQPSSLIFDGTKYSYWIQEGTGVTENDLSTAYYQVNFRVPGGNNNSIGRVELDIKKYGAGSDLTIQFLQGSTVLKSITFPAKIFSSGWISLPVDLSGLTPDTVIYSMRLLMAGDSTNRLALVGESITDGNVWKSTNGVNYTYNQPSFHRRFFYNDAGTYQLRHGIYGTNAKTLLNYDANNSITEIWRWLPASDGTMIICDRMVPTFDVNGVATRWTPQ